MDYKCDDCGKAFSRKATLTRHLRTVHEQKPTCRHCKVEKSVGHLKHHEENICSLRPAAQPPTAPEVPQHAAASVPPPPPPATAPPNGTWSIPTDLRVWTNDGGLVYAYNIATRSRFWVLPGEEEKAPNEANQLPLTNTSDDEDPLVSGADPMISGRRKQKFHHTIDASMNKETDSSCSGLSSSTGCE